MQIGSALPQSCYSGVHPGETLNSEVLTPHPPTISLKSVDFLRKKSPWKAVCTFLQALWI